MMSSGVMTSVVGVSVRGKQDVVDPETYQDVLDARLIKHVAVEAHQAGFAEQRPEWTALLFAAGVEQTIPDEPSLRTPNSTVPRELSCNRSATSGERRFASLVEPSPSVVEDPN